MAKRCNISEQNRSRRLKKVSKRDKIVKLHETTLKVW